MNDEAVERAPEGWHLDKRINIAHILTTAGLVVMAFSWGAAVEKRQAVIETRQESMEKVATTDRAAIRDLRDEIRETNRKMDRLLEVLSSLRKAP